MTRGKNADRRPLRTLATVLVSLFAVTSVLVAASVPARASTINYYYPNCSNNTDPTYGCGSASFNFTGFTGAQYCTAGAGNCDNSNPSINVYNQANGAAVPNRFSACWMYVSPGFMRPMDTQATTDNLGYYSGFSPGSSYQVDHHATNTGCQLSGQHMGAFLNPTTQATCTPGGSCQGGGAIWYYRFQTPRPKPWFDDANILDSQGRAACIFSNEWLQYSCPTFRLQSNWDVGRWGVNASYGGAAYSNIAATFFDATDNAFIQWQIGVFDTRYPPPNHPGGEGLLNEGGGVYDVWTRPETGMNYGTLGCNSQNYEQTRQPQGSTYDWYEMLIPWWQMYYLIGNINSSFAATLPQDTSKWELYAVNVGVEMVPGPDGPGGTSTVDWIGANGYNLISVNQAGGTQLGDGSVC